MYEPREWASEDARQVRFVTSPGAFERESVFAQAFDAAASFADSEHGDVEYGSHHLVFRAPFNLNTLEEARDITNGGLTSVEEEVLEEYAGAILRTDSQGFRYLTLAKSAKELEALVLELEEADADEEGWK